MYARHPELLLHFVQLTFAYRLREYNKWLNGKSFMDFPQFSRLRLENCVYPH